jgi:protein AroM
VADIDLALLTIGQAPRPDLSASIRAVLPGRTEVEEFGVLDGLSRAEAEERFGVRGDGPVLVTRLQDGGTVALDPGRIEEGLQRCIERLEGEGVRNIAVLCTGEFPALRADGAWLMEPDRVITTAIPTLVRDATVGVLVPLVEQIPAAREKWSVLAGEVHFAAASPFDEGHDDLVAAAEGLVALGARALVLDCMAYGERHHVALRGAGVTVAVLVSGQVFAHALAPFLS